MSQRVVTSFLNTNIPGAYPNVTVQSKPVGLGASGIVVIFGEAEGGDSFHNVALKDNHFTPDQLDKVSQMYISGQIVDAMAALSSPSNDANINGTANLIYIAKTNNSTKASAIVDTNYGTLSDKNWGTPGNSYKYQTTALQAEAAPSVVGAPIPSMAALAPGLTFNIRNNGAVSTVVTLPPGAYTTGAQVAAALTGLPAGVTASGTGTGVTSQITLTETADPAAWTKGWGKSFELIDVGPGNLALLGLTAQLAFSSAEPELEVAISNANTGLSETLDVLPDIALNVGYQGTTATLTIAAGVLSTTVAGGSGVSLSVTLANYRTIADLATYIAAQAGYSASAAPSAQQLAPSALDLVAAIGIASTGAGLKPGRIKDSAATFQAVLNTSNGVMFTPLSNGHAGIPTPMASAAFLSGGTRGATTAADIVAVVNQFAGIQVNIIIPLFSQDATADTLAGQTDSGSTYTIAAINALVKNHCIQYSTPKLKRNRIAILSFNGTYAQAKSQSQGLGNYRTSVAFQKVTQVNSQGAITVFQPWYASVVAAGMQAGGFYKSITNKLANVISHTDPSGFDSGSPGDVEDALSAGLLILTSNTAGELWVSDQTTYGFDTNFVYNSIQAVYCSDILALDLAASFQAAFVGQSLADVDAATAESYLAQKMDGYKKLKLIAASDDAPLGWKNPKVSILAPEMDIAVEIKLATAIYFIPISISISQVQQSA